jgi:hypothetical protein
MSQNSLRALPFWTNPVFEVKDTKYSHVWRERFQLHRVRDMIHHEEDRLWTLREIEDYLDAKLVREGDTYYLGRGNYVTVRKILDDWSKHTRQVPQWVWDRIQRGITANDAHDGLVPWARYGASRPRSGSAHRGN